MSATRKVLKWTVAVDDREHPIGPGKVCLVACQNGSNAVQVWTEEEVTDNGNGPVRDPRAAVVIGTGHKAPDGWEHIGSALAAGGALVWHLYAQPRTA